MNAVHEELRAQLRAKGGQVSGQPKPGSRFDPSKLRGKNAARWAEYRKRRDGKPASPQLWAAP